MQLCHTHRQLLSRCTPRWYSVGTSSDAIAASDVQVPSRLKRPVASTFGGINIQNVVVPTQPVSHYFGNKTKKLSRFNGSNDQSSDVRSMSQTERKKGMIRGGASSLSSWGDGLVSLSFASRLKLRQDTPTTRGSDTEPHPQEAQSRKQKSYQAQHPQMHGHRRGQKQQEYDDASQTHHRGKTETRKSVTAAAVQRTSAPSTDAKNNELKASLMTRPSSSPTLIRHPKSTTTAAAAANISKADTASLPSSSNAPATQQPTTPSSDRKARLATLSSTNLNALFHTTTNTPTAGISTPSLPASTTTTASDSARARVRGVLERSAGDYSRFLPRDVGVRKDVSRLPALRAARQALATQRDLSLEQRRVALHIIGGLVQPRREVRAS
ncbi:hypothetical protein F5888DRAFT_1727395 [Russula emetica]|nr:hypothetical protein F5888DRAFT_1727395 [Russula emetica]